MPDILVTLLGNLATNRHLIVILLVFYLMAYLAIRRAVSRGQSPDPWWGVAFWGGVGALIGGRLVYVLPHLDVYLRHPLDLVHVNFGLHLYGGLAGGLLGAAVVMRRAHLSFGTLAALMAPFLPLAIAMERFGCLVGPFACFGRVAFPPLGIYFPGLTLPRYPSHLYEGLLALAVVAVVLLVERREPQRLYRPFLVGLAGYGLARALVDTTRLGWTGLWMGVDAGMGIALSLAAIVAIPLLPHLAQRVEPEGRGRRIARSRPRRVRGRRGR